VVKLTVWNDSKKPHKGRIKHWIALEGEIHGFYVDHPQFKNQWGHTTSALRIDEPNQFGYREIETRNSRYTLVGEELTWEEYVKKRQELESEKHAQAHRLLSPGPKPVHVQGNTSKEGVNKKQNGKPYYTRETQTRVTQQPK
jgi:hypothetical protein